MTSRLFPLFGLSLAMLAACSSQETVRYRLTFDSTDPGTVEELTNATIRVIERRLDRMEAALTEQKVTKDPDGVTLELTVSKRDSAATLTQELTAPFDLQIMTSTSDVANADLTVEGFGAFNETSVTGKDIVSVIASGNPDTKGGMVKINFTDTGLGAMREIFKNNVQKDLGLFVRGRLVSVLTVASPDLPNPLVIDGIPDQDIARIFADDVNVGIHVTVTPL